MGAEHARSGEGMMLLCLVGERRGMANGSMLTETEQGETVNVAVTFILPCDKTP